MENNFFLFKWNTRNQSFELIPSPPQRTLQLRLFAHSEIHLLRDEIKEMKMKPLRSRDSNDRAELAGTGGRRLISFRDWIPLPRPTLSHSCPAWGLSGFKGLLSSRRRWRANSFEIKVTHSLCGFLGIPGTEPIIIVVGTIFLRKSTRMFVNRIRRVVPLFGVSWVEDRT